MTETTNNPARPGSDAALEAGCTCPVMDNCHGAGRWGNGEKYGWYMNEECPIHGRKNEASDAK